VKPLESLVFGASCLSGRAAYVAGPWGGAIGYLMLKLQRSFLSTTFARLCDRCRAGLRGRCGRGTGLSPGDPRKVNARELVASPETVAPPPDGLRPVAVHLPGMPLLVADYTGWQAFPRTCRFSCSAHCWTRLRLHVTFWIAATLVSPAAGAVAGALYAVFLPQAWAATGEQDAGRPGRPVPGFRAGCVT